MAQVADRVVAELEARNGAFNASVRGSAAAFDQSMTTIERSATRAESRIVASNGLMSNSLRNLGFQISDIGTQLASGTSPFLILAQQGPQVSQALGDVRTSGASMAAVLRGVALPGFLAIASILPPLIMSLLDTANAHDQVKKAADSAAEAEEALQDVLQGTIDLSDRARIRALELARARAYEAKVTLLAAQAQLKLAQGYAKAQGVRDSLPSGEGGVDRRASGVSSALSGAVLGERQVQADILQGDLNKNEILLRNLEIAAGLARGVEAKRDADKADKKDSAERRKAQAEARRAEREAARAAEEEARNRRQFGNELASGRIALIEAEAALTSDTRAQDEALRQRIIAERDRAIADINADPDRSAPQRQELVAIEQRIADARLRKVNIDETERFLQEELSLKRSSIDNERDLLDAQIGLVDNSTERREIALRLLDLAVEQEREQLKTVLESKKSTDTEKKIAERRLQILDQLRGIRVEQVNQANVGPGGSYLQELNRSTAAIGEDIDRVAVSGFERLNDQLVDAIMNSKSLGDVFKSVTNQIIADLLRIAIQQAIIKPLANSLFGGGEGLGSAIGALFGGFRATGGPVAAGRAYVVGERGPEMFIPNAGGKIAPNQGFHNTSATRSGAMQKVFNINVSADNSVTPAGFAQGLAQQILSEAARMDAQTSVATRRQSIGDQAYFQDTGSVR